MNHLAHFRLSFGDTGLILGNWSGDHVKGDDWKKFPPEIQKGILLHRSIDAFTDEHPASEKLRAQLRPFAKRFAGPVSDIVRDYFLALCWPEFSKTPIRQFADHVYSVLAENLEKLPEPLPERTPRMIQADWLTRYDSLENLQFVLQRFEKRLHPHLLDEAGLLAFLEKELDGLLTDFRPFFEELLAHAGGFVENHKSQ